MRLLDIDQALYQKLYLQLFQYRYRYSFFMLSPVPEKEKEQVASTESDLSKQIPKFLKIISYLLQCVKQKIFKNVNFLFLNYSFFVILVYTHAANEKSLNSAVYRNRRCINSKLTMNESGTHPWNE